MPRLRPRITYQYSSGPSVTKAIDKIVATNQTHHDHPMRIYLFSLLLAATNLYALDAAGVRKIASEPHSRDHLIPELRIFPDAREYKITTQYGKSADKLEPGPELIATEKTVRGRYLVSTAMLPGSPNPLIMVVTYEKETDIFKKWVLLPDGTFGTSTGIADFNKRTIAWTSDKQVGTPPTTALSLESHSDDKSSWKEITNQDGSAISISQGLAVKTK